MIPAAANLERILTLIPVVLASPGITVQELARRFETTREEIHADLARVLLAGVPPYLPNDYVLVDFEGDRVYLSFAERFARPVGLLVEEALALRLALENLAALSGSAGRELAAGLIGRIEGALSAQNRDTSVALGRVDAISSRREREVMDLIAASIHTARPVEIVYYTVARDAISKRIIWPRRFIEREGALLVIAYCPKHGGERSFRLDRIREIQDDADVVQRAGAPPPPPISNVPAPTLRDQTLQAPPRARHKVVLRFDAEVARFVEERVTRVVRNPFSGEAKLELETEHFEWIYAWLLPFGGHAEIVSPPAARAGYIARLEAILAQA